jgi:hypothetical protein
LSAVTKIVDELRASRAELQEKLSGVTEEQMLTTISRQQEGDVNVRFYFYRLIAHEAEHTVHLIKTLAGLDINQSEAQLILRNLQAARGELEGLLLGLSDEDLDRAPSADEWAPRRVLEHIIETEKNYGGRAAGAL